MSGSGEPRSQQTDTSEKFTSSQGEVVVEAKVSAYEFDGTADQSMARATASTIAAASSL